MKKFIYLWKFLLLPCWWSCTIGPTRPEEKVTPNDTFVIQVVDTIEPQPQSTSPEPDTISSSIYTGDLDPLEVIKFSQTLLGTRYKYASVDPAVGFDCSGFITYVFNRFNIKVPRSSRDFTDMGKEVPVELARPGDLILFTGTDSTNPVVGHMGIVTIANADSLQFIHSSSGKANGVTTTPLNQYYKTRFVKVIRIFPERSVASGKK